MLRCCALEVDRDLVRATPRLSDCRDPRRIRAVDRLPPPYSDSLTSGRGSSVPGRAPTDRYPVLGPAAALLLLIRLGWLFVAVALIAIS
jgi:hypothetical protein